MEMTDEQLKSHINEDIKKDTSKNLILLTRHQYQDCQQENPRNFLHPAEQST